LGSMLIRGVKGAQKLRGKCLNWATACLDLRKPAPTELLTSCQVPAARQNLGAATRLSSQSPKNLQQMAHCQPATCDGKEVQGVHALYSPGDFAGGRGARFAFRPFLPAQQEPVNVTATAWQALPRLCTIAPPSRTERKLAIPRGRTLPLQDSEFVGYRATPPQ